MKECRLLASKARRKGFPGPSRCCCPTNSSRDFGRSSSASGALGFAVNRSAKVFSFGKSVASVVLAPISASHPMSRLWHCLLFTEDDASPSVSNAVIPYPAHCDAQAISHSDKEVDVSELPDPPCDSSAQL
uniref:Uncharacterized protein n=1 Tax=Heterorhabditis bacteriophora TaxID=37862 RepID=A0A1I7WDN5_HETBA